MHMVVNSKASLSEEGAALLSCPRNSLFLQPISFSSLSPLQFRYNCLFSLSVEFRREKSWVTNEIRGGFFGLKALQLRGNSRSNNKGNNTAVLLRTVFAAL